MKRVYKILFIVLLQMFFIEQCVTADSLDVTPSKGKSTVRSIWKYEQDFSKYNAEDGIAKKVYYLCLNDDGTYNQYIMVVPEKNYPYMKAQNYTLDGTWEEKNGQLILEENGKKNAIAYTYFVTNFENIDNQIIYTK
jgi:hypothetical protein